MDQSPEAIIDFIHKLHGAAAMTGANALKNQLNQCETLLKNSLGVLNTSSSTDLTYNTKEAINEALQEVYHQIALVLDWHKNNNMDSTFKTQ
jgi:HPt (histidine-containing phosphotransfer) domain-containing protein